jgi:general secretion pathway protein K
MTSNGSNRIKSAPAQRGIALIAVLFALTLLALFAAGLVRDTRTEILVSRNYLSAARAEAAADAAVFRAISELADRRADTISPEPLASEADGTQITVTTTIEDEGGKIDLNRGHPNHLRALMFELGIENHARLADAIADFRDSDDNRRNDGAEWSEYRAAGLPYVAHNRPFRSLLELRLVLGITDEIFHLLQPYITVYSRRRGVDPRYALEMVLRAIPGLDDSSIDALIEQRTDGQRASLPTLKGAYIGRSNRRAFTVRAEARTSDGSRFVRVAVIELRGSGGNHRVHRWEPGTAAGSTTQASAGGAGGSVVR